MTDLGDLEHDLDYDETNRVITKVAQIINMSSINTNCTMNTTENEISCPDNSPACSLYLFILYGVLLGPVAAAGIAANLVTFIVFWKDAMKTSTSFLLQSLAVIDIVLLITAFLIHSLPQLIKYPGWPASWYTNFVHALVLVYIVPVAFTSQTATVWVTILVAVNRYIAVCRPYQAARLCTVGQARWQLGVVMALCLLYNLPRFLDGRLETVTNTTSDGQTAIISFKGSYVIDEVYTYHQIYLIAYQNVCYTLFLLLLPFVALSWLNFRLIHALSVLRAKRALMQSSRHQQQQDSGVTLVLVVVIIVFLLCQTPAFLNQIFWNVLPSTSRCCGGFQFYFRCICNLLVTINSATNFIIYVQFNKRFRRVFIQLITCQAGAGGFVNVTGPGTCAAVEAMTCVDEVRGGTTCEALQPLRGARSEEVADRKSSIGKKSTELSLNYDQATSSKETVLSVNNINGTEEVVREGEDSESEDTQESGHEAMHLMQNNHQPE